MVLKRPDFFAVVLTDVGRHVRTVVHLIVFYVLQIASLYSDALKKA